MMEIGKTYGNLMVDVQATNTKLKTRAMRIVMQVTGAARDDAEAALTQARGSAKLAIVMLETGLAADDAKRLLEKSGGFLRRALAQTGRH
jgi:N-acetylmuramic acid 6-phosphate etherase